MIVQRQIVCHLQELTRYFPILSLTGLKQGGKKRRLKQLSRSLLRAFSKALIIV